MSLQPSDTTLHALAERLGREEPQVVRYELSTYIGPCTAQEAEALMSAILNLDEFQAVYGGGVTSKIVAADDPNFRERFAPSDPSG